jgi:NADPH:quinone reductase-like Zn-dependent oxidoreductase
LAIGAVRDGGGFAAVRGWSMQERGVVCHVISVRRYNHRADLLRQLRQDVHKGVITLRVAATYSPEQASDAHRRLEAGGTRGRLVIVF